MSTTQTERPEQKVTAETLADAARTIDTASPTSGVSETARTYAHGVEDALRYVAGDIALTPQLLAMLNRAESLRAFQ